MKYNEDYMEPINETGRFKSSSRRRDRIERKHKEKDAWHERRKARDYA